MISVSKGCGHQLGWRQFHWILILSFERSKACSGQFSAHKNFFKKNLCLCSMKRKRSDREREALQNQKHNVVLKNTDTSNRRSTQKLHLFHILQSCKRSPAGIPKRMPDRQDVCPGAFTLLWQPPRRADRVVTAGRGGLLRQSHSVGSNLTNCLLVCRVQQHFTNNNN